MRALDYRRDLESLGELISLAFAGELEALGLDFRSEIATIKRLAPLVAVLSIISDDFRHLLDGYVFEDQGRIIASVTVQRQSSATGCWEIGTVATHPDYRRRGLARRLVERAVEHVQALGGKVCTLEVRADNTAAYSLYRSLGFSHYDSITDLKLEELPQVVAMPANGYVIGPIELQDWEARYDLARRETPSQVQAFLPVREGAYRVSGLRRMLFPLLERLQRRESRWWGAEQGGRLAGCARLKARQSTGSFHELQLTLDPPHRAVLGEPLLMLALEELQNYPRQNVVVSTRTAYEDLLAVLKRYGFVEIATSHKLGRRLNVEGGQPAGVTGGGGAPAGQSGAGRAAFSSGAAAGSGAGAIPGPGGGSIVGRGG
jgi:ribosomal protein S18 acetylase RimI-like enzyme